MSEIEQAHKILQDVILNGRITLKGSPMSLVELGQVVKAEQLLFAGAVTSQTVADIAKDNKAAEDAVARRKLIK